MSEPERNVARPAHGENWILKPLSPASEMPQYISELVPALDRGQRDATLSAVGGIGMTPGTCHFLEVWPRDISPPFVVTRGHLAENEITEWLYRPRDLGISHSGGLQILYGSGHSRLGREDLQLPFHEHSLREVIKFFNLPNTFFQMMQEESTRCSRTTLFGENGDITGFTFCVRYFSWWLGTGTLAVSYDLTTRKTRVLILSFESTELWQQIIQRVISKKTLSSHPMLLPLIFCDVLAQSHGAEIHISTKRIFLLEQHIGVNDYGDEKRVRRSKPREGPEGSSQLDFTYINRSLNGELSRLANYEKSVTSHVALLDTILGCDELSLKVESLNNQLFTTQGIIQMREYGEYLRGWNVDLLARIACQQKIVDGGTQTVYNLLAQRDNKLNVTIAQASKRDSTAMKTIAILTMVFLPGAYVATLFSINMFNWHAGEGEHVLSGKFWIYWAVTLPITALVLVIWMAWSRPWTA